MQTNSPLKTSLYKIIVGIGLLFALASPAFAIDGDALVSRFQEIMQQNNLVMRNAGVNVDGNRVTLHDVRVTLVDDADRPDAFLPLGDVTFNQVEEGSDGSYTIRQASASDTDTASNNDDQSSRLLIIQGIEVSDIYLAPRGTTYRLSQHLPYSRMAIRKIAIENDGKNIFTAENAASIYSKDQSDGLIRNESSIEAFMFDPSALPGTEREAIQKTFADLGYDRIEADMHVTSTWEPVKGSLDLSRYDITMKDGGTLSLAMKLNGVTQDLLGELQKISIRMGQSKKDEKINALALLGLVQQVSINSMTIRYDDNSLANRLLDSASKTDGQPRAQTVAELKTVLPLLASQLQNPEFADKTVKEMSAFLDNPKSLEISAMPEKSVSFAILATTAITLPQKLIDVLGLRIAANQ